MHDHERFIPDASAEYNKVVPEASYEPVKIVPEASVEIVKENTETIQKQPTPPKPKSPELTPFQKLFGTKLTKDEYMAQKNWNKKESVSKNDNELESSIRKK